MKSESQSDDRSELPLHALERIDRACDRFEAAWKEGQRPRIEDYLGEIGEPHRAALLRELLAAELEARRHLGERLDAGEYRGRFPGADATIEDAFVILEDAEVTEPAGNSVAADARVTLLCGLLGYQTGLIGQSALVDALTAWVKDKTRSVSYLLADLGALDSDRRALLEGLVGEHLRLHDGDVEKSLAALPAGASTRRRLANLGDTELTTSLARISSGPESTEPTDGHVDGTGLLSIGSASCDGLRFRVLRPHARGGLGAVFVALDTELHREVALKQMLDHRALDAVSRSRFLVEAEITGGLEHPGIVPVYGLGTYADGRPYYAMRFIRGESLKDAIGHFHADLALGRDTGRRSLALRMLLRRFTDVCNAIEYAHTRGVLHRDIKPGNVIVGKHGETLVVDWGLAKPLGQAGGESPDSEERLLIPSQASGTAQTLPGSVLGTPAYMSPEQARGEPDRLDRRSDVYSLGVTLYFLLTNRAPFESGDVSGVLHAVQEGAFRSPRHLDPDLDRSLEAVCLKAMALYPQDRYDSARALADDIDRWLADEPVTARREPVSARVRRWARRNRTLVAGVAVLLVAATVALTAGAILLSRANARTELRRLEAERNFELARDAVDRYYTRVSEDRLLNEPQMERLRRDLLETARDFYQKFVDEHRDDPRARADLGNAYLRLSQIASALGAFPDAIGHGKHAEASFATLAAEHPEVAEYRRLLSVSDNNMGNLYHATGRVGEAEAAYSRAQTSFAWLANERPEIVEHRRGLASSYNDLGNFYSATGRSGEAESSFRRAIEIDEKLAEEHPELTRSRRALAVTHSNLGVLYKNTGRATEAEVSYRRSIEIGERLSAEHPEVIEYGFDLAASHNNLGELYIATGRAAKAEAALARAIEIQEKLVAEHPGVTQYRHELAVSHSNLGNLSSATDRPTEAEVSYRRAIEISEKLTAEHREVIEYRSNLARLYNCLGVLYFTTGRPVEAETAYRRALEFQEKLAADHPEQVKFTLELGGSYCNLGNLVNDRGDPHGARTWYDRALAPLQAVLDREPRHTTARQFLCNVHWGRANALTRLTRFAEADAAWDRAFELDDGSQRDQIRFDRAAALARAGDHRRAIAETEALAPSQAIPPGLFAYALAGVEALASAAARADATLEPPARAVLTEELAVRAVATLCRARDAGFFRNHANVARTNRDRDLDSLRSRDDFRLLMQDLAFPDDAFARDH
jgi:serine/threonine-protein kinase